MALAPASNETPKDLNLDTLSLSAINKVIKGIVTEKGNSEESRHWGQGIMDTLLALQTMSATPDVPPTLHELNNELVRIHSRREERFTPGFLAARPTQVHFE